jgi:hypothetical protein
MSENKEIDDRLQVEAVLGWLEERLREGHFNIVDMWLEKVPIEALNSTSIIAALTITFWGKDKLTQRDGFLARVEPVLKERLGEERANKLLLHRR